MRSRLYALVGSLTVVALAGASVWWFNRPEPVPTETPAGAPATSSCWALDVATSRAAHPWTGQPVDCAQPHTIDIFSVAQVDTRLVRQHRDSSGADRKLAANLMYAQARMACSTVARSFLGGDWHSGQVEVLANWIKPDGSGFFACGVAQTADPAGSQFVPHTGRLAGALASGATARPLQISCVARESAGAALRYAACTEPHDGEFIGTYMITPPQAPFDAEGVTQTADKGCKAQAARFLGLPDTASRKDLYAGYVGPTTASGWLGSDQTFACYVMATKQVRGTLKNLGTKPLP